MKTRKEVPNFPTRIVTPIFRISYPHLFKPVHNEMANNGKGRDQYDLVMLFDKKDKAALQPMYDLMKKVAVFNFGENPKGLVNPIKDGDTHASKTGELLKEKNPTYAGMMVLNAWTKNKPGVASTQRDAKGDLILIQDPDEVYGGCYCRAELNCYGYDVIGNRGISFGLIHVQKIKDGDPFGNRSRPEDAFAPLPGDASMAEQTQESGGMFD